MLVTYWQRNLSEHITTRDLLKTLALVLMIVDHIGFFFFPDDLWWRLWGRLCVPLWFFLIGYTGTRSVPATWYAGAALIAVNYVIFGGSVFPLSILINFALCRIVIERLGRAAARNNESLLGIYFMCLLMGLHSSVFIEYGTLGALLALTGYFRKNDQEIALTGLFKAGFIIASVLGYGLIQFVYLPGPSAEQALFLLIGLLAVCGLLYGFRPAEFPAMPKIMTPIKLLVQFTGRWTLEVYVVHIIVLSALRHILAPQDFPLFAVNLFPKSFQVLFG